MLTVIEMFALLEGVPERTEFGKRGGSDFTAGNYVFFVFINEVFGLTQSKINMSSAYAYEREEQAWTGLWVVRTGASDSTTIAGVRTSPNSIDGSVLKAAPFSRWRFLKTRTTQWQQHISTTTPTLSHTARSVGNV